MYIVFDHDFFENMCSPIYFILDIVNNKFQYFNLSTIFAPGNKILMYYYQYGDSLKFILNLINDVGVNELYILHCFGSSLACLDHINNIVSIYGYYAWEIMIKEQFVQIQ